MKTIDDTPFLRTAMAAGASPATAELLACLMLDGGHWPAVRLIALGAAMYRVDADLVDGRLVLTGIERVRSW